MIQIIGFIITGFIVGLIARALKPGDDRMSIGKTTLLGIVGALLMGVLGHLFGWYNVGDGAGIFASVVGAIVVLFAYHGMTHRNMLHH